MLFACSRCVTQWPTARIRDRCAFCAVQVRQAVAEFAILPLGSQVVHERLPHIKSLLLYGAPKTGKTMLAHVSDAADMHNWAGR